MRYLPAPGGAPNKTHSPKNLSTFMKAYTNHSVSLPTELYWLMKYYMKQYSLSIMFPIKKVAGIAQ